MASAMSAVPSQPLRVQSSAVAREPAKTPEKTPETYGDVVLRLEDVVKRLEAGELSLEDSLKAFEEGIGLVRRGEKLLGEAEKRIEQLLHAEGEDKAVALELPPTGPGQNAAPARPSRATRAPVERPEPPPPSDDDVPF